MADPYYYNCNLDRVIDGDTIDVDIDLGFNVVLSKRRVRLMGIDTPESRTRDLAEKKLGLEAKDRLIELCGEKLQLLSHGTDKYGRVLGVPHTINGEDICQILVDEGHAVPYFGGKKTKVWGDY
jgi:micrococcal nuclease